MYAAARDAWSLSDEDLAEIARAAVDASFAEPRVSDSGHRDRRVARRARCGAAGPGGTLTRPGPDPPGPAWNSPHRQTSTRWSAWRRRFASARRSSRWSGSATWASRCSSRCARRVPDDRARRRPGEDRAPRGAFLHRRRHRRRTSLDSTRDVHHRRRDPRRGRRRAASASRRRSPTTRRTSRSSGGPPRTSAATCARAAGGARVDDLPGHHRGDPRARSSRRTGLEAGRDFALGYSPERIDPGQRRTASENTPKIVARPHRPVPRPHGLVLRALRPRRSSVTTTPREAEMAKLIENTFRQVNIALVNELAIMAPRDGRRHLGGAAGRVDEAVRVHAVLAGAGRRRALHLDRPLVPVVAGRPAARLPASGSSSTRTRSTTGCPSTSSPASARR